MTLPLILAMTHMILGSGAGLENYYTSSGKIVSARQPLILKQDSTLENYNYDGEIWLGEGRFTLRNVTCKGIRLSRVKSADLTNVRTDGADIGLWIIGGGNVTVRNSVFKNHRVGIEGGPGDPWTFPDEARARGIRVTEGKEWTLGMNLCGMLETRNKGITFVGNGLNRIAIGLGKLGTPPYKLDGESPLADNHWDVTGKTSPRVVAESSQSFVLEAEGVFEKGKRYWAHTYNRKYEIKNIQIYDSRFEKNSLAGISLYFVDGVRIERNYAPDVTSDYEFGLEHGRNALIADNRGSSNGHKNIRIGLLGRMENIVMRGNSLPLAYMDRNQPELGITADAPVDFTGGHRSPWVTFR